MFKKLKDFFSNKRVIKELKEDCIKKDAEIYKLKRDIIQASRIYNNCKKECLEEKKKYTQLKKKNFLLQIEIEGLKIGK